MKFLQEFKAFALKGNVMDMAVGVIIGGAFGKIVTSLVNDILMPPIGMLLGNVDFKDLKVNLAGGTWGTLVPALRPGGGLISALPCRDQGHAHHRALSAPQSRSRLVS